MKKKKKIHVSHSITRLKKKNLIVISVDGIKESEEIQNPIKKKKLRKLEIKKGNFFNLIMYIHKIPAANIFIGGRFYVFPLRLETKYVHF